MPVAHDVTTRVVAQQRRKQSSDHLTGIEGRFYLPHQVQNRDSSALDAMRFRPERIRLDPAIHAAEQANRLVVSEGIPFREAYRRVAAKLKGPG